MNNFFNGLHELFFGLVPKECVEQRGEAVKVEVFYFLDELRVVFEQASERLELEKIEKGYKLATRLKLGFLGFHSRL